MALQPDVIVLVLTQNDIIDIDNHQWLETDDTGAPVRVRTMITYPGPDGYIITGLPWHYEVPYLRESYVFIGITDRIYSLVTDRIRSENATHADLLARFRTALRAIGELSDRNRVELLVTIVPPPFRTRILKFREDYEVMRQSLADLGRDYIDLKPLLRPDDYFFSDGHFSRRGHGTVANLLFPQISERLAGRAPPSARTACQMVSGEPATAAALSCTSAMHRP
jgi:hypothetical protein